MVDDLKEFAEKQYTDEEFVEKRRKYTHAQPFTKESLLYREIFERYYPDQSEMVVDFWMPNKTWPGCDVNDRRRAYFQTMAQAESETLHTILTARCEILKKEILRKSLQMTEKSRFSHTNSAKTGEFTIRTKIFIYFLQQNT